MEKNTSLFLDIIAGTIPCTKVYEDQETLAFLDIHPVSSGHVLVVPKVYSENLFDCSAESLKACLVTCQKIATAMQKALEVEGVTIIHNAGKVAGQVIFHTHFHVIPRRPQDGLEHWHGTALVAEEAKRLGELIQSQASKGLE